MSMITPPVLTRGSNIGIVAPAGWLTEAEILPGVELLRSWGLNVVYGKHLFKKRNSFAGSDDERTEDFQYMLDDNDISAILCARGGYGSIRIIENLKFGQFLKNPKWVIGYSDITVIHSCLQQRYRAESIHGVMPRAASGRKPDIASFDSLRSALFGDMKHYELKPHSFSISGKASGMLVGGNLSVLYSLTGTRFEIDTRDKILFIEDVDEYLYHVERMIMNLKLRHKLMNLKGLIVGGMHHMKTSSSGFKKPAYKIIQEAVAEYDYPVMFGFPAGHGRPNLSLVLGREVEMEVSKSGGRVVF